MRIASVLSKVTAKMEIAIRNLSIAMLVILVSAVFMQVVRRTITGNSFVEIEEFSIVMAAWLASFTIAYAVRKKSHVLISVFTSRLPLRMQKILAFVLNMIIVAMLVAATAAGWNLSMRKMLVPMTVLPLQSGYWYLSFPVGFFCACVFMVDNTIQAFVDLKNDFRRQHRAAYSSGK